MYKKIFFGLLIFGFLLSTAIITPFTSAVDTTRICGMDGTTYSSAEAAEATGVDVSYEFACVNPTSESNLYEDKTDVHFVGMLVEIGSTDVPTTIIVRPNEGGLDVTVNVTEDTVMGQRQDQYTNLSDWIPGDQIRVIGQRNENTNVVDVTILVNHSIVMHGNLFHGANGWITAIDKEAKVITYQWYNVEHQFTYDDNTRFVAAGKNPAAVDDLKVNDRIRGRLLKRTGEMAVAKIVVVLRRGSDLYMKIRTFRPNALLVRLDSTIIPTTIQVKIMPTPGLDANDVNNLIGTEGNLVTVNVNENTRIVRKYFGQTTLDEFSVGDNLRIVGRVNDDGTVDAKLIKNNSIWKTSTRGYAGVVTSVDVVNNYLMVNWTPYKHITRKQLTETLQAAGDTVSAQTVGVVGQTDSGSSLTSLIKNIAPQIVGQFTRSVQYKKVVIDRIMSGNVTVGELIERLPPKRIKVKVTQDSVIIVGINNNATISDIKIGDKIRSRGVWSKTEQVFYAETIVVVNSLPELEEDLDTPLNVVNEIVDEIVTDDPTSTIADDTTTVTEEIIVGSGAIVDCTADAKVCADGTVVSRIAPDCEFAACPTVAGCSYDAKICADGTIVGRVAPDCVFAPCPGAGSVAVCGNHVCEEGEEPPTCYYETPACEMYPAGICPQDCESTSGDSTTVCGNNICEAGEAENCPACATGENPTCAALCIVGTCTQDCTG